MVRGFGVVGGRERGELLLERYLGHLVDPLRRRRRCYPRFGAAGRLRWLGKQLVRLFCWDKG